ncbi:MAG: dienelactone hydrolase family protein [Woeseiaceae bacterium]
MRIESRLVDYCDETVNYQGRLTFDRQIPGKKPGVLVAHTIRGRTAFEERKAEQLAGLGYAAFALDLYGAAELGSGDENTRSCMQALLRDRTELRRRVALSLATLEEQPEVDAARTAAIGFCFGGLCVLDLARSGANVAGVASFHGLLDPPEASVTERVNARVLVLHGWDDPLAKPKIVLALAEEMTAAGADWQLHAYGNTVHAFTNPAASDSSRGTVYDAAADRRSWAAMADFLNELFSG